MIRALVRLAAVSMLTCLLLWTWAVAALPADLRDIMGWTATIVPTAEGADILLHNESIFLMPEADKAPFTIVANGISATLIVRHTPNNLDDSSDVVEVLDVTPGWVAIPATVSVPEQGDAIIRIVRNLMG